MKTILHCALEIASAIILSLIVNSSFAQSAIYGGGPIYQNRSYAINELKNSGFTHIVVWTIHIDASGNFNFNGEFPLCTNGAYVGNSMYPNFAGDMSALKTGTTSIKRIEFCLSAWGSSTFDNIKNLIASQGTGSGSMLYKNFQALKNAIPVVDAIGFDDESTYDVNSSTSLAVMLGGLGFKVTLVPYTAASYWTGVATNTNNQRPGTVDRIDLQCYAGGAGNDPCNWNFGGIPVYAGLWDQEKTTAQVQSQLTTWKNSCAIKGGFIWLYDDIDNSAATAQYATAIKNVFGGVVETGVATVYKDCVFGGTSVDLPVGSYTLAQLQAKGVINDDISSLRVSAGYELVTYLDDNFTGATATFTADDDCLVDNGINDLVSSLKVRAKSGSFTITVQAESYLTNFGVQLENTTDAGAGQNVGWIDNGDWMAYNPIAFPTTGAYLFEYRVASPNGTGVLSLDLNGGQVQLGTLGVPNTGGWQNWTTISHTVNITAGTYNVGIFASTGGWNINWWRATKTVTGKLAGENGTEFQILKSLTVQGTPNPFDANTKLSVNIPAAGHTEVNILSGLGKEITRLHSGHLEEGRHDFDFNAENMPSGLYIYHVIHNGKQITGKLIKR